MSFSQEVKSELAGVECKTISEMKAQAYGMTIFQNYSVQIRYFCNRKSNDCKNIFSAYDADYRQYFRC